MDKKPAVFESIDKSTEEVGHFSNAATINDHNILHYAIHIPKTGGTYFAGNANEYLMKTRKWKTWNNNTIQNNNHTTTIDRPWLCKIEKHIKHDELSAFPGNIPLFDTKTRHKCTAYTIESDYNTRANYTYTILREPKSHVLSQYFHCKESTDHQAHRHLMPSLDEWLQYWYNETINNNTSSFNDFVSWKEEVYGTDNKFKCYRPVNLQSRLLRINNTILLEDDLDAAMKDIESKFTIIGDNSQMMKSMCSIITRYSNIVPDQCDCSVDETQRLLSSFDHNVKHHGDNFNITNQQREWIDEITKADQKLYKYGKIIFARQVEQLEKEFDVKLCS